MRYLCAPDSFKESLTAAEAARAMAEGIRRGDPDAEIRCLPMADGGEGTARALADAYGLYLPDNPEDLAGLLDDEGPKAESALVDIETGHGWEEPAPLVGEPRGDGDEGGR